MEGVLNRVLKFEALFEKSGGWFTSLVLAPGIVLPWIYMLLRPPPPKMCGTRNGPPITADRIRLRDGRYMAFKEAGVPRDQAKFKVIFCHPFAGSRNSMLPVSEGLLDKLGVYMVAFDRPGYGQSDAFPQRSVKSQAEDIEQLADALQLGDKFHVISLSMGGFSAWACLKYIPHRLAGVALMAPVVNFWWSGVDSEISRQAFETQGLGDRISLSIAHHAPWLLYTWLSNTPLPTAVTGGIEKYMNKMDVDIVASKVKNGPPEHLKEALQQGVFESLHRDLMVQFGAWGFFPGALENRNNIPVQVWQGDQDYLVPVVLQRQIQQCLPWLEYHELAGVGHMLDDVPGLNDRVLTTLLDASTTT